MLLVEGLGTQSAGVGAFQQMISTNMFMNLRWRGVFFAAIRAVHFLSGDYIRKVSGKMLA